MASSSRWKRFAFFDRKNLPLPPSVVKDVVPPELSARLSNETDVTSIASKLYPEETAADAARIGIGGYFSLSCSNAVLPGKIVEEGGVERNTAGEGVAGMVAGLMARVGDVEDGAFGSANDLQLVFVSSRNTPFVHCVDVTARCTPINPQLTNSRRGSSDRDAFHMQGSSEEYNAEELDGWRGYYDPFSDGTVKKQLNTSASGKNAPVAQSISKKIAEQRILEEHLSTSVDSSSTSLFASSPFAALDVPIARIVALASCFNARNDTMYVAAITDVHNTTGVIVHTNPHLRLKSSLPPQRTFSSFAGAASVTTTEYSTYYKPSSEFNFKNGNPRCVSITAGVCCVGTDSGVVFVYVFDCHDNTTASNSPRKLSMVAEIPAPRGVNNYAVSNVELIVPDEAEEAERQSGNSLGVYRLFVSYRKPNADHSEETTNSTPTGGVCCYDLGGLRIPGSNLTSIPSSTNNSSVVSARYDMDGRDVPTPCLCDAISLPPSVFDEKKNVKLLPRYSVARGDGLHLYSCSEKVGVCTVDGVKIGVCSLPLAPIAYLKRRQPRPKENDEEASGIGMGENSTAGATYVLMATTDAKANRDALDIFDISNKLLGFHVLLSPGHRALRTVGMMSAPVVSNKVLLRGGRSSGVVFTSGGSIVTLTGECELSSYHIYPLFRLVIHTFLCIS